MGLERPHAELIRQGQGLPVVGFSGRDLRRLAMRGNLAEEPQGIRLVTPFLSLAGMR